MSSSSTSPPGSDPYPAIAEAVSLAAMGDGGGRRLDYAIADALRCAADRVVPDEPSPFGTSHRGAHDIPWLERQRIRAKLLAIADELDRSD